VREEAVLDGEEFAGQFENPLTDLAGARAVGHSISIILHITDTIKPKMTPKGKNLSASVHLLD
jgi:hypothetical protein